MSDGGWANIPPPPPEGFDHETAKAVGNARRDDLKRGMASTGLVSDIRHDLAAIVTLPWRLVKGVVRIAKRPFKR